MKWLLFIGGAVTAVFAAWLTAGAPNGLSLLGVLVALAGFAMIARDDVKSGL